MGLCGKPVLGGFAEKLKNPEKNTVLSHIWDTMHQRVKLLQEILKNNNNKTNKSGTKYSEEKNDTWSRKLHANPLPEGDLGENPYSHESFETMNTYMGEIIVR